MLEFKSCRFEMSDLRESEDAWVICGYISTYDTDRKRERVRPGAPDKALQSRHTERIMQGLKSGVRFLWHHDQEVILGWPTVMRVDVKGVYVEATFLKDEDFPEARKAYKLAKLGLITDFSIGYTVLQESKGNDGLGPTRDLDEIDIQEFSLVVVPMNPAANVTEVKSQDEEKAKVEKKMEEIKSLRDEVAALRETVQALVVGLSSSRREDLTEVEAVEPEPEQAVAVSEEVAEVVLVEASAEEQVEVNSPTETAPEEVAVEVKFEDEEVGEESPDSEVECLGNCPHCGEEFKMCKPNKKADQVQVKQEEEKAVEVEVSQDENLDEYKGILSLALELKAIICEGQSNE